MPENQQKLSENLEDYLETISSLSAGTGAARPSDIAAAMSVKRPSVTAALNSLREKGLVEYEKYKPVTLTKDGEAVAMNVRRKHRLLSDFFTGVLGVNASEADLAACRMEHALDLLDDPSLSIKEIAYQVGCRDQFQFSRQFRSYQGCSPLQYRKLKTKRIQEEPGRC